jgi:hypothetical protein
MNPPHVFQKRVLDSTQLVALQNFLTDKQNVPSASAAEWEIGFVIIFELLFARGAIV